MGLDTRAFAVASREWREAEADRQNREGTKPGFFGLVEVRVEEPVDADDVFAYHQDGLEELGWPGGLVGGMISGHGNGPSFRGKVYDGYVEAVTGRSLYAAANEMWGGELLAQIAKDLRAAVDKPPADFSGAYPADRAERLALAEWFEICVRFGLVVGGDY